MQSLCVVCFCPATQRDSHVDFNGLLSAQIHSMVFPFLTNPSLLSSLKSDFCHLSEILFRLDIRFTFPESTPRWKAGAIMGHTPHVFILKDHSAALPVSHFYSCLWWHGYSDMRLSVMMRSRGCSDQILLCIGIILVCLSSFVRLKASQGQSVNYSFLFILQSIVHSLIMLAG